jgi:hypothetical protein
MDVKRIEYLDSDILDSMRRIVELINKRFAFSKKNAILNELEKLKDIRNIRLLRFYLMVFINTDKDIASKAESMIADIMADLRYDVIKYLDNVFRNSRYIYSIDLRLDSLRTTHIKEKVCNSEHSLYLYCLLSLFDSGYIRECALRSLANIEKDYKVYFILLRTNDWVEQVRAVAQQEMFRLLHNPDYFEEILNISPVLEYMHTWQRSDSQKLLMTYKTQLLKKENRARLFEKFAKTKNIRVKRILFECLVSDTENLEVALEMGIKTKDPIILRRCFKEIECNGVSLDLTFIFDVLGNSKSAICKIASMDVAKKIKSQNEYIEHASKLIYDKSKSVREHARYILKNEGVCNFEVLYREVLEEGKEKYGAICGLMETGNRDDFDVVIGFVNDRNLNIRKAALSAATRLDVERAKDYLLDALASDEYFDSNYARKLLVISINKYEPQILCEMFNLDGLAEHVYFNIIMLANHLSKWNASEQLLCMLDSTINKEYIDKINDQIDIWIKNYNNSFVIPPKKQIEYMKGLFMKNTYRIEKKNCSYLQRVIDTL